MIFIKKLNFKNVLTVLIYNDILELVIIYHFREDDYEKNFNHFCFCFNSNFNSKL